MTNEEAKAIIRKKYLCVDRDCDIEKSCGRCDLMIPSKEPILQAYKMAMDALEQEPCLDWYDVPSNEMTLEQARQAVKDLRKKLAEYLEQEPCEDIISRQVALDEVFEVDTKEYGRIEVVGVDAVMAIPSAYKGMTNGEVIKAMFPNFHTDEMSHTVWVGYDAMSFHRDWWDSPYDPQERSE